MNDLEISELHISEQKLCMVSHFNFSFERFDIMSNYIVQSFNIILILQRTPIEISLVGFNVFPKIPYSFLNIPQEIFSQ